MLRAARPPKQIGLRSAHRQPLFEHLADCIVQSLDLIALQRGRCTAWVDSGQPHAFIRVAIAQSGQHMLIEQYWLQRAAPLA
jgi:hypothetical protein